MFLLFREQSQATMSAQTNALLEAKEELNKVRRNDDQQYALQAEMLLLKTNLEQAYKEIEVNCLLLNSLSMALMNICIVQCLKKVGNGSENDTYYGKRNSWTSDLMKQEQWSRAVSQVLESIPLETLQAHPPLQQLQQHLQVICSVIQDANANGTG